MWISADRWTCPTCRGTEVVDAQSLEEAQLLVRRVQWEHAREHAGKALPVEEHVRRRLRRVEISNAVRG